MSVLSVKSLSYDYLGIPVLRPMTFELSAGEVVGLIGPNGAGKSTLLKCLSHYIVGYEGSIKLEGQNLHEMPHSKRAQHISYLPQNNEVSFPFLVKDVVEMGLYTKRLTDSLSQIEVQNRILASLKSLDIEHLVDRQVTELSGGEKQLVHLARVLVQDTKTILLDEPSASLDIGHEATLMNSMRLEAIRNKCIVVALHNLNTAAEFCDRLILLNQGELIEIGSPDKVLDPKHVNALYGNHIVMTTNSKTGNRNIVPNRWVE